MEEVSNGSFTDYPQTLEDRGEILEDVRETLRESISEALSVGKILVDRLQYPLTAFTEAIDAQGVIEEFENMVDELKLKQQGIDTLVQRFGEMLERRRHFGEAVSPVEKYVVSETPLLVEVEVFEEEVPIEFANEKMNGTERDVEPKREERVR